MSKPKETKIIEAILHNKGWKTLMRIVYRANTIERLVADMQEIEPKKKITMQSVITWKYITLIEAEEIKKQSQP